ncbi:MAG: cytochrome P450 [Prochloraceae cyanobacterium]
MQTPPGSFGLPLIGETLSFFNDPNFLDKRLKKYGSVFKTHIFGRPTVFMTGADANVFILTNENKYFSTVWPRSTTILLGVNSVSTQQGSLHSNRRKILYQAFQPRALENYVSTMKKITNSYLETWSKMGNFTWYPELRSYTFDIACKLLVGTDNSSETILRELFETWCQGLFTLTINLPWTKFGKALKARKKLLQELEKIILERQQQENLGTDALGLLLQAKDENGKGLPLEELKDQILTLLFAGHETLTSSLISFCLLVGQNQEIYDKISREQEQFNDNKNLDFASLKDLVYLEQVLKEVLRFIPPVGGAFREAIEPFEFKNYSIPQGWSVQYSISNTSQDKEIYQNPELFNPDRFNSENAEDRNKTFGYIPFGGGIRECLGKEFAKLEMKIFAAMLVKNYRWEILPNQDLSIGGSVTPCPRDGLQVKLSKKVTN